MDTGLQRDIDDLAAQQPFARILPRALRYPHHRSRPVNRRKSRKRESLPTYLS